jgi:hypothetical protein
LGRQVHDNLRGDRLEYARPGRHSSRRQVCPGQDRHDREEAERAYGDTERARRWEDLPGQG